MSEQGGRAAGTGPLARIGRWVAWWLVLEGLVVLTSLPGFVGLLFLDRSAASVPLVALCAVPIGPSLAAAAFAWHRFLGERPADRDATPLRAFLRGYVLNWRDVLVWWVPLLVVLALLGVNAVDAGVLGNVAGDDAFGGGNASALVYVVAMIVLLVWAGNALVITSLFSFRTRDVLRLAAYYLGARPLPGLGVLALVILAAAAVLFVGDLLLWGLASAFVLALVRIAVPVTDGIQWRFVSRVDAAPR